MGSNPTPSATASVRLGQSGATEEAAVANKLIAERYSIGQSWWTKLTARPDAKLHAHISPSSCSLIGFGSGARGVGFNYSDTQDECTAELYIDRGADAENEWIFDQLNLKRPDVETAFGEALDWQRLENR